MKRFFYALAALLIFSGTTALLVQRWQEESADRSVTLLADWSEVRDEAARAGIPDAELLKSLHQAGANALLIGASTVQDYLPRDFIFSNRSSAETVLHQLLDRGVAGVLLRVEGKRYRLVNTLTSWDALKDLEVGVDPDLLLRIRESGLREVFRVNDDPWLSKDKLFRDLRFVSEGRPPTGFLLNTDDVPGGKDALSDWRALLEEEGSLHLMFEFHPAKAALKLAYLAPSSTFRAHTIAPNELKDLTDEQQRARWRRAIEERSCRFLLFHISPGDSLSGFLGNMSAMRDDFLKQGWEIAWPETRLAWKIPSALLFQMSSLLSLLIAILMPVYALRVSMRKSPWRGYGQVALFSLAGACVMAALAYNPYTRIEIVPFRGVKAAFALAWLGSFLSLYTWHEIKTELYENVRRIDIVAGLAAVVVIAYVLIRMGNASAGWKAGWEQGLRDRLEVLLVARPRFKEFAIGYPLLLLGFHMLPHPASRPLPMGEGQATLGVRQSMGRFFIGLGMIGPISMVNTFCHLHSPLYLAFWRSMNGFALGTLIGFFLLSAKKWLL